MVAKQYVAFLRAINVAGHATVKMKDLRDAFTAAGCKEVNSLIQSGNVFFEAPADNPQPVLETIPVKLRELLGLEAGIMFRTVRELERVVQADPFKAFANEPEIKRYVTFLAGKPRSRPVFPLCSAKEALEALALKGREVFVVSRRKENGFFGFPNEFIEKALGIAATSRNWTTLIRIMKAVQNAAAR